MSTADELKDQGVQLFQEKKYEEAAQTFRDAAATYEDDGTADMVAEMQVNLGLALHLMGEHDKALEQMNMAHAVFVQMDDRHRAAQVRSNMGRVYAKLGNSEQALTYYREASAVFSELNDKENYGQVVMAISDLKMRGGKVLDAAVFAEVGVDYVKQPNMRQKIMKQALRLRNIIFGGGLPPLEDDDEDDA